MAATTGTVAMLHLTTIDDSHCLESAVGMFTYTRAFLCRRKFRWTCIIQKQERTDHGSQVRVRKESSHWKSIANPMAFGTAQDAL
jgi:hypothetical protein